MATVASPRHDDHVHACSLAQAMAVAARRQRGRSRVWSPVVRATAPPAAPPSSRREETASGTLDVAVLLRTALALQLEAAATRQRALAMLADDREMRLRLEKLTARAAARRDGRRTA